MTAGPTGNGLSTPPPLPSRRGTWAAGLMDYLALGGVLVGLVVVFGLSTEHFLSRTTFDMIASQVPGATIAAVGMTFVLIIAGIDLSVGSVLGLSGAVLGVLMVRWGVSAWVAVPACLGAGLLCGAVNGLVTVAWRLPSFIVTLGMLEIARGGAMIVLGSRTAYIGAPIEPIAETRLLGLPVPFVVALGVVALGQLVLARTVFGRHVVAVGSNEETARLCGVGVRRVKLAVFALCGLLAALAGVMQVSRAASANPNAGAGFELDTIAAVVIGGTSLMGGRGSVVRSFFGVLIIAVLGSGLAQLGVQDPTKRLITGLVIVAAAVLDYYRRRLNRSEA
ncbi:MAG TPA: ABC transporter permease [Phycisphaerae bacterium]|nr:ABC transporter permease [Phycisphaerae bacterium]